MTGLQITAVTIAFATLLLITLAAQFGWLGTRRAKAIVVFLAGVIVIGALRIAMLPPTWFEGSRVGFGLALSFFLGAFISSTGEQRAFGRPLFLGLGVTLLLLNCVEAVRNVL